MRRRSPRTNERLPSIRGSSRRISTLGRLSRAGGDLRRRRRLIKGPLRPSRILPRRTPTRQCSARPGATPRGGGGKLHRRAIALKARPYGGVCQSGATSLADQGQLRKPSLLTIGRLRLSPQHAENFFNLGVALQNGGRSKEAVAALSKRAIELRPDYPQVAYCNIGKVLTERGDIDQGIAVYRHAIALKPDYAEAHSNLGNALQQNGRLDEASGMLSHQPVDS